MCGIFGIFTPGGPPDTARMQRALNSMDYRGPDAWATYSDPRRPVLLGHRRLSIIDLSEGANQPMEDPTGRYQLVYNGEIYSFPAVRRELEALGVVFTTNSDTEVVLHAWIAWGEECLQKFNGMFAFCIYDRKEGSFFLARDRIGKKPLFYSPTLDGGMVFSSELKGILLSGMVAVRISTEAVNHYFSLGYVPGEMCLVEGVRKLPAATFMHVRLEHPVYRPTSYWDVPEPGSLIHSENEAAEELELLLKKSVRERLVSDVPLGAFLSGGIDSSLIVSFMRDVHEGEIRTFSVGFAGSRTSELDFAREVARKFGTTHEEFEVVPDIEHDLETISRTLDEPIFDSSLLPTYYLSKMTRQRVTVALSGDGGDELFAGYIHYHSAATAHRLAHLVPPPLNIVTNGLARGVAALMPEGMFGRNTLLGMSRGGRHAFLYPQQMFREDERVGLFRPDLIEPAAMSDPVRYRGQYMLRHRSFLDSMCYTDLKTTLVDDILVKVDRASMMNSLEVRCPLLDHRVVDFAFSRIPPHLKLNGGIKKHLLKVLARRRLPESLQIERKQGFDIPADLMAKTFLPDRLCDFPENEFLRRRAVHALAAEQRLGRGNKWHKLFALYYFLRWLETWRI